MTSIREAWLFSINTPVLCIHVCTDCDGVMHACSKCTMSYMYADAKKLHVFKLWLLHTHIQPRRTERLHSPNCSLCELECWSVISSSIRPMRHCVKFGHIYGEVFFSKNMFMGSQWPSVCPPDEISKFKETSEKLCSEQDGQRSW